jgi:hypothetical protein
VTCRAGVAGLVSGLLATADAAAAVTAARLAVDESIRLDGALNEAAWRRAGALDDLRQSQPLPGAAASQRTVVRLAWDDSHLFIAIEAFDAEPGRIVARQMQRDSELFFDDHVTVVLDPHGRAREGYLFRVNPVGARSDALIFESQREDYDWDGRWHAAARMHDAGWTAEIAIPFTTLSLDPEAAAWGDQRGAANRAWQRAGAPRRRPAGHADHFAGRHVAADGHPGRVARPRRARGALPRAARGIRP